MNDPWLRLLADQRPVLDVRPRRRMRPANLRPRCAKRDRFRVMVDHAGVLGFMQR
jgi:hypothetical protein